MCSTNLNSYEEICMRLIVETPPDRIFLSFFDKEVPYWNDASAKQALEKHLMHTDVSYICMAENQFTLI